jgi:hypothetical protein
VVGADERVDEAHRRRGSRQDQHFSGHDIAL